MWIYDPTKGWVYDPTMFRKVKRCTLYKVCSSVYKPKPIFFELSNIKWTHLDSNFGFRVLVIGEHECLWLMCVLQWLYSNWVSCQPHGFLALRMSLMDENCGAKDIRED